VAENDPPVEEPKPPKRRRLRRRWVALIVVAAVIVVLIAAAFVTAHFTSSSSFCDTCHEMDPYYQSWQASIHSTAECRDCHIPPGFVPYVKTKLFSFREVWVHITSKAEPPLAVTRQIPNSNCLACHKDPGNVTLTNVSFSHEIHSGQNCITCHVRVVHRDVNPPYYKSPAAMSSCLVCHDGKTAPSQCSTCHTPGHEPRGECSTCHNTASWTGATMQHPFVLTGAHASLACTDCHVSKPGVENIPGTVLAKADPACVSCHGDHHGGLTDCASCHTPDGWSPSTFVHPQVGEHIPSGERPLDCASCHPSGYATHSCTKCHATNAGGGGD
jgi:nitrate/TMAO reductase-like tetraheme cytochrome c subunit